MKDVSIWNVKYLNEEQVFSKPEYGIKLVVPPSSVEEGQKVEILVSIVTPEESKIILPSDVELVSCIYKIKTTGKFTRPIKLHLQHNVELRSQEESKQLAFIRAKGPPPYKFKMLPHEYEQLFRPGDNFGVVSIPDFCLIATIIETLKNFLFQRRYAMTVFFKKVLNFTWEMQAVVTKDLGPFLQVCSHNERDNIILYICSLSILESEDRGMF